MKIWDDAIGDCAWLRKRRVPEGAVHSGYTWACLYEGDKHGVDFEEFKAACNELKAPVRFGFTEKPAYTFDIFKGSTAYHQADCPVRCPLYKGDYRYEDGICPVAEDTIWRIINAGVMEIPIDQITRNADLFRKAIERMG